MYFLIAVLLIIVIIFGVSSGMQSYATAQQAQAQIETAKVAQISSWGNLITILTIMLIVLFLVVLIAMVLWMAYRNLVRRSESQRGRSSTPEITTPSQPQFSVNDLVQLEILKTLQSLHGATPNQNLLSAPREEQPADEPFSWLR